MTESGPAAWRQALSGALRTAAGFGNKLYKKAEADDALFVAGGVAFGILLAGLPFFLLLAAALGYFVGFSDEVSTSEVARVIRDLFPDAGPAQAGSIFDPLVRDIVATRGTATLLGALTFLWFSTRLFGSMRGVLNKVFAVPRGRHVIIGKLHDLGLTLATTLLLTAWVGASAYIALARTRGVELLAEAGLHSEALMGQLTYWSGRLVTFVLLVCILFALYSLLPNRKVRAGQALFGAIAGSLLFEVARVVFSWIIAIWNPASLYSGTVAAIVIVVFWVYYAALIVIVGGEVSQVREELRESKLTA